MVRSAPQRGTGHDGGRSDASAPSEDRSKAGARVALAEGARLAFRRFTTRFSLALRVKVVILLGLAAAIMLAVSGLLIFHVYDSEAGERMHTRAVIVTDMLASAIGTSESDADLRDLVARVAEQSHVDAVAIIDESGRVVATSKDEGSGFSARPLSGRDLRQFLADGPAALQPVETADPGLAAFLRRVSLPGGEAAAVFIRLDQAALVESLKAKAWSVLVWLTGAIIVGMVMVSLLMQRIVVGPIEALRSFAERREPMPDLPSTSPGDEIAIVASALANSFKATSASESRLASLAHTDGLTGLGNWTFLKSRLAEEIAEATRTGETIAVMILNLDKFKDINDTLGHDSGDAILQRTADILRGCQKPGDIVARLGADEFGVVIRGAMSSDEAVECANRFIRAVGVPFRIGAQEIHQTACVGLTLYPQDARDPDVLLKNADLALSRAKFEGSSACVLYRHELHLRVMERNSIERDLRAALAQKQFVLYYQPKVDITSGRISGAEALIRWQHPERGLIAPDLFVPVAERCGFIGDLTRWVLDEACRQNRAWQEDGLPKVGVAVNVSAVDLRRPDLSDMVANTLVRHAISPQYLELEVTESMVMRDVDVVIGTLRRLRSLGVGIGIDDFGTGYSSLAYLKRFPVKRLKIDRSFVRDIADTRDGKIIPKVIIDLAHSLGLNVLAEGVENVAQLEILRALGCDEAQGYFLGRPMPAAEFEVFLRHAPNGLHPVEALREVMTIAASASTLRRHGLPGSAA